MSNKAQLSFVDQPNADFEDSRPFPEPPPRYQATVPDVKNRQQMEDKTLTVAEIEKKPVPTLSGTQNITNAKSTNLSAGSQHISGPFTIHQGDGPAARLNLQTSTSNVITSKIGSSPTHGLAPTPRPSQDGYQRGSEVMSDTRSSTVGPHPEGYDDYDDPNQNRRRSGPDVKELNYGERPTVTKEVLVKEPKIVASEAYGTVRQLAGAHQSEAAQQSKAKSQLSKEIQQSSKIQQLNSRQQPIDGKRSNDGRQSSHVHDVVLGKPIYPNERLLSVGVPEHFFANPGTRTAFLDEGWLFEVPYPQACHDSKVPLEKRVPSEYGGFIMKGNFLYCTKMGPGTVAGLLLTGRQKQGWVNIQDSFRATHMPIKQESKPEPETPSIWHSVSVSDKSAIPDYAYSMIMLRHTATFPDDDRIKPIAPSSKKALKYVLEACNVLDKEMSKVRRHKNGSILAWNPHDTTLKKGLARLDFKSVAGYEKLASGQGPLRAADISKNPGDRKRKRASSSFSEDVEARNKRHEQAANHQGRDDIEVLADAELDFYESEFKIKGTSQKQHSQTEKRR